MTQKRFLRFTALLMLFALVLMPFKNVKAAAVPKLSKTQLTFTSDKAKAQTIKLKNVKASQIKSVKVENDYKDIVKIKVKDKVKFTITPKRSGKAYNIRITVTYKKKIKGVDMNSKKQVMYLIDQITVNGTSKVQIKTAEDFKKIKSYSDGEVIYVLANDIDLTGKGFKNETYEDSGSYSEFILDGQGHTIKSDSPVFDYNGGIIKNVNFEINYNVQTSKNDFISKLWTSSPSMSSDAGLAPIMNNSYGQVINCTVKGTINVNYDKELTYQAYGADENDRTPVTNLYIGGLVGNNGAGVIKQCSSDVKISFTQSTDSYPFIYIGGIAGHNTENYDKEKLTISESRFGGNIEFSPKGGTTYAGGIVGYLAGPIKDCLSTGSVKRSDDSSDKNGSGIAGFGSSYGSITNSVVLGDPDVAIYGNYYGAASDAKFTNNYYLTSKTINVYYYMGTPVDVDGITGISDADVSNASVFAGFDFDKIWEIGSNGIKLKNVK